MIESAVNPDGPGRRPVSEDARRLHLPVTVAQGTIRRLDELCARFSTTRGRLIDKMTDVVYQSYQTGKVHCVMGQVCSIGRQDLPAVF